jgi:hypothetical protein
MMARITPEHNYPQDPDQTHQSLHYQDSQQPTDLDEYYVPEREFVLMPLFRRIGRMLGFKRAEEPEYVYSPEITREESVAAAQRADTPVTSAEAKNLSATTWLEETLTEETHSAAAGSVEDMHAESLEAVAESYADEGEGLIVRQADDILGLEPEREPDPVNHFTVAEENAAPAAPVQAEVASEAVIEPPQQQTHIEAPVEVVAFQAEPQEAQSELVEQVHEPKQEPETLVAAAAVSEMPPTISAPSGISQQEASDLAKQIREAATKISAAVAQAAEWLHTKEEEVLRRAEMPLAPERRIEQEQAMPGRLGATASNTAATPEWEPTEAPALQRERAWQEKKARFGVISSAANQRSKSIQKRLGLNVASLLAYWRRIDWAQEFAPKRVAILGGVLMAILMVLGISFARRPASSDLPQQTRSIEPRGVTLTTHPVSAAAPAVESQSKRVAAKPTVESSRARRSSALDNEPDVVTHYYNQKAKPSPSHPATTVAGVKHYSDMQ